MIGKIETTTLENGCRVVTAANPAMQSVSLCFDAGIGSRHEAAGELGYSHFLEHMLFKGSEKYRSTRAVSQPVERLGGSINAFTSTSHTCFFAMVPYDAANIAFDVIGDIFTRPLFPPRDIALERRVVLEEMKMYHDDDSSYASELCQAALWPRHPLGRPILGTPKTLAAIDHDALVAYHRGHYTAAGTIVAAAGRVEHARVVDFARRFSSRLSGGGAPRCIPASRAKKPVPLSFEERETQQVQAVLAFRAFPCGDKRRSALAVLSQMLGRGLTSRLFMSLREKRGLAYSIGTEHSLHSDCGAFQVFAGFDPARSRDALSLCAAELRRIAETPAGRTETNRAIGGIVGAQRMGLETSASQMLWILDKTRKLGFVETPDDTIARISAVTPEDVRSVAADIFRPEGASLALVMPRGGPAKPEELLRASSL
ncbi:MAG: insulinase family protein [Kiritimatiellae bacterium]|nr:insulinase family protein [Kiritimatiellia bacterium]